MLPQDLQRFRDVDPCLMRWTGRCVRFVEKEKQLGRFGILTVVIFHAMVLSSRVVHQCVGVDGDGFLVPLQPAENDCLLLGEI